MQRDRLSIGIAGAATVGLAGAAAFLYAHLIEPQRLVVRRLSVAVPHLPPAFTGYTILHLSDLHVYDRHGTDRRVERHLRLCAELAEREDVDLVAVTGDLVERTLFAEPLGRWLSAIPARDGVYAVLGNHDHGCGYDPATQEWEPSSLALRLAERLCPYFFPPGRPNDVPAIVAALEQAGVQMLLNRAVILERKGQRLWLAGVDDPYQRRHSLADALRDVPPDEPCVLLAHAPDILPDLDTSRPLLVLMGHTHGGQVRLPFIGAVTTRTRVPLPDAYGLHRLGQTHIYITCGMGGATPLRFLCPPEVTLIRLVPAGTQDCAPDLHAVLERAGRSERHQAGG